jgi:hypothetical protein
VSIFEEGGNNIDFSLESQNPSKTRQSDEIPFLTKEGVGVVNKILRIAEFTSYRMFKIQNTYDGFQKRPVLFLQH